VGLKTTHSGRSGPDFQAVVWPHDLAAPAARPQHDGCWAEPGM